MFVQEDTTHSGIDHQPANPRISTKDHGPKKSTSNPSPAHRAVDDVGKTDPRKIFLHIMYRSHCCCCVCLDSQAKTPKGPSPVPASSSALPHPHTHLVTTLRFAQERLLRRRKVFVGTGVGQKIRKTQPFPRNSLSLGHCFGSPEDDTATCSLSVDPGVMRHRCGDVGGVGRWGVEW